MSEIFESYERKYCELSDNLSNKCSSANLVDGEQKKQKISEIKAGLDEADALIRKMDLGARGLQPNVKAVLLTKLREYKSDLNNLKNKVKRIALTDLSLAARDDLLETEMAVTFTIYFAILNTYLSRCLMPPKFSELAPNQAFTHYRIYVFHKAFRDDTGSWGVGFSRKLDSTSITMAELLAARESLELAWERRLQRLELELDSEVVNLIKDAGAETNPLGNIIKDCRNLIIMPWDYRAAHTRRSEKSCADSLSKMARDLDASFSSWDIAPASAQKDRLLMSTKKLNSSSNMIRDSIKVTQETNGVGVSIIQDLHQQNQSVIHANDMMHGVDDNISKSKKVLTSISGRMNINKWVIGSIIVVLLFKLSK